LNYLTRGRDGKEPETLKGVPFGADDQPMVQNVVVATSNRALGSAARRAAALGYEVWNLGAYLEGETRHVAKVMALLIRGTAEDRRRQWQRHKHDFKLQISDGRISEREAWTQSAIGNLRTAICTPKPLCILSGGETTVTLPPRHGKGGRNQEFVLAMVRKLGARQMRGITILCAGTDGEDGPTDAAGAIADQALAAEAEDQKISKTDYLGQHNAYPFFEKLGGLFKTGLTHTNVMDLRVMLIAPD
jgi:hydroxypyruvate reductase/glycerate 2-kinase